MKKSKKLSLVLMGSLLTTGMLLSGCEETQEVQIFKNVQECTQNGFTEEQCKKLEEDAKANTPKFSKREECEAQFGKEMCTGGTDSVGSYFVPALAGFMVGRIMGNKDDDSRSAKYVPFVGNGIYNDPTNPGTYQSAKGQPVKTTSTGKGIVPKSAATFRGGFSGGARATFGG